MLVHVNNRPIHEVHDEVFRELVKSSEQFLEPIEPALGGVREDGSVVKTTWPSASTLAMTLSRLATFVRTNSKGEEIVVPPPGWLVKSILESWQDYQENR